MKDLYNLRLGLYVSISCPSLSLSSIRGQEQLLPFSTDQLKVSPKPRTMRELMPVDPKVSATVLPEAVDENTKAFATGTSIHTAVAVCCQEQASRQGDGWGRG